MNFVICSIIIARYQVEVNIKKIGNGKISEKESIYSFKLMPYLLLEIFINMIFIPPTVHGNYRYEGSVYVKYDYSKYFNPNYLYDTNSYITDKQYLVNLVYDTSNILTCLMFLRSYHIIRFVYTFSYWSKPTSQRMCKLMNADASLSFSFKAYMKVTPFTILITFIVNIVIVSLCIKIFEYYNKYFIDALHVKEDTERCSFFSENYDKFGCVMKRFSHLLNSIWLVLITMTTSIFLI